MTAPDLGATAIYQQPTLVAAWMRVVDRKGAAAEGEAGDGAGEGGQRIRRTRAPVLR